VTGFVLGVIVAAITSGLVVAVWTPRHDQEVYELGHADGTHYGLVKGYQLGLAAQEESPLTDEQLADLRAEINDAVDAEIDRALTEGDFQ
jgi:hypothetical protein